MNTNIMACLGLVLVLTGCGTETKKENEELKEQTEKLRLENEQFKNQQKKFETTIEAYKRALKEIDNNLKAVDTNSTMVGKLGKDGQDADTKETILARIKSIKTLLDNSKLKAIALDKSLNELRKKYGEQSEVVLELNRELKAQARLIIEKENEFLVLRSSLEEDMEELQQSYEQQLAVTEQLRELINRAYYYSGNSKDLKDKGIVDMEGGFIGMGRVKVLNANSSDKYFTQIKKDATDTLTFVSKSLNVITQHPESSFQLTETKEQSQLVILDKTAFWKNGNYLIVQTN